MPEYRGPLSPRRRSHLLVLEPRMMFDAAAAVTLQDAMTRSDVADHAVPDFTAHDVTDHTAPTADTTHDAAPPIASSDGATMPVPDAAPHDIIFIDTAVADYRQLAETWAGRGQIVFIDSTRDGLSQMQAALAGQSGIDAIHIVSHGAQGVFWLGTTRVDEAAITGGLAGALGQIGQSLGDNGDILIYGCDFAEGNAGASAVAALAHATDADIAASTDITGAAVRGGDWALESHSGTIEARTLDGGAWVHTLDPNTPIPIAVTADSLTVVNGSGVVVVSGATGYGTDARSPDVGVGAVATWSNVATFNGQQVDLRAVVVSISAGDAVRFNRPTGTGLNGDDPTFLLRDLTAANDATMQIRWELVVSGTTNALPADVRFTIADIDGIGGNPNTRESVSASTTGLAYYTRERVSDIFFTSSLSTISASGTQNENTTAGQPLTPKSAATFDWSAVSSFTLNYTLTTNTVTTQAQFYHDGDADFLYTDPVYVSIPRLDLDGNDSTAAGNDAHFTFTENGPGVGIVDADVVVANPMDINAITGASVVLTNYHAGDTFTLGTLPSNIAATIGAVTGGSVTITLTGNGSETDYANAFRAITFSNTSDTPNTDQRVITVSFSNDTLTSAIATSRIDVVPVNDAPVRVGTVPAQTATDAQAVNFSAAGLFSDPDGDTLTYSATGLPAGLTINATTGVISGTIDRSASQVGGGVYAVVITARDPSNATVTQGFSLTVTNPAPHAVNDTASTSEDISVVVNVLGNDTDPDGDPLTVTGATALHGTVAINGDGTLTYTPDSNYNGSDTISYSISDGQGGTSSATVAVTIDPVNDAPVPVGTLPSQTTVDGATVAYPVAGIFTDMDGDTLSYSASGLPAGLSIDAATGLISGTVDRSASQVNGGVYTVVVTASDPASASATRSFTITIADPAPAAVNDTASTNEDTPVVIDVLGNDSDPDGDPLTVTTATALHGSVAINADGTLTYTPDANYNGLDTISYSISDGQGGTSSATVAVTIDPVNDAPVPVGTPSPETAADADTVSYPTAGLFSDVDGDTLSYSATGLPIGLSIDPTTGVISGTIDRSASQVGGSIYTVVVTARDPSNATATQDITLTVTNPAPTAVNDSASTSEDMPVVIDVLGNDNDPDGDPLTVTTATALHGSVAINPDNTLTYTPDANYNGSDTISYAISDGQGGTSSATVAVTINPVNDVPVPVGTPSPEAAADADTVSYPTAGLFRDVDGDTLTYSVSGLPAGLSIDPVSGVISGIVDRSASQVGGGVYTVVVTAKDPSNATATQTITLTVTNPAPIAVNDGAITNEDTPVVIDVLGNDSDPDGDPLTVTVATALHGTVAINADGTLTYTPDADYNGADTISYSISDGQGGTSSATVSVTIDPANDAPVPVGTLPSQVTVDGATVAYPVAGIFTDVDGDTLSYSASGLPAGLTMDAMTGLISGTVDRSASQVNGGTYTVVVTATDPSSASATRSFTIDVSNPAPIAVNDSATTNEDTPVVIDVLGNDSDPDGDPLTVTTATALHGSVAINGDGTLTYTPAADYNGTDTISYSISDGQGGTSSATVSVTIDPVNDAPVPVGTLPSQVTVDGATVAYPVAGIFTDVDGDTLSYSASGLPAGLSINAATGLISGSVDRSASQVGGGVYTVVVTASDPSSASATRSFTIDVSNPAPIAVNDSATTNEDLPVIIAVLGNDSDPDGDPLTVTTATALHGSVTINADNTLTYTPNANYNGSDTISYAISDGQGGTSSATVAVTINPVNDAPVATGALPDRATSDAAMVSYPTASVFSDVDGDTLIYSASGLPAGLTIDAATGVISGTVDRSASQVSGGGYPVVVTARDPSGATATRGFVITVVNPGPVALNDSASTSEDTPVVIAVLGNDGDPDGDPLTVTGATALHGSVSINPDNTLTYTPNANYNGSDTINYSISDGQGGIANATVAINIVPVNDAPLAAPTGPALALTDGSTVTIPVAGAFSDPDGDVLTYSASGLPAGLTIDPATGIISGTVDRSASQVGGGSYTVSITARDPSNASVTQTVNVVVSNPAPNAAHDDATTPEDTAVVINVLANDSDPDGDPLIVSGASALNGSIAINPDRTVTYTPNANFNGTDTITYTISDGQGGSMSATVTVVVTPANDAPVAVGTLPGRAAAEGTNVSYPTAGGFADIDGDTLTYSATGLPVGLTIDPATGVISGVVDRSASQVGGGAYAVIVTARDPAGASVTQGFTLTATNPAPIAAGDSATTNEDMPVTIAVLGNDVDPDGDPLTVTGATALHGAVTINADGTLTYTPNADYNGSDTISYSISDGQGGTSSATVAVTIVPVNDAPVATGTLPDRATTDAATIFYPTAGIFSDIDGDTLTYSATGLPAGLGIDPATGIISGTVDRSASQVGGGVYAVTITVRDPAGASVARGFTITVGNPAPTAVNDSASTSEDVPVTIGVLGNDVDPDGDPLTVTSATALHGSVTINADGTLTYAPNANYNGSDTISYAISDGQGGTSSATVAVTIVPVNDAPVAIGTLPPRATVDAATVSYPTAAAFGDVDGDMLTYSASGLPAGLSIDAATGVISGSVDRSASQANNGAYSVVVTARDPSNATATLGFPITVTNPVPTAVNDTASTVEDMPVTILVLGNDSDPDGDPLTVTGASALHGSVTINADGTLTYTPNANYNGTDTISYAISDGQGGTSSATIAVTITPANDAPVPVGTLPATATQDGATLSVPTAGGFADIDGDTLTYSASGLPAGVTIDPATGIISGTVDRSASQPNGGVYAVVVTARDPSNATATQALTITVANPGPIAVNDSATVAEDGSVTIPVLANDSDPDGDPLTVTGASALHGSVTINADGKLTYIPVANYNGTDTISYSIGDGQGGTANATVAITVSPVNDAPGASGTLPPRGGVDGAPDSFPTASGFSDLDGDTLTYSASGLPTGLAINPATGVISGTIDRSASQPNGGAYIVVVTARDPSGATATQSFAYSVVNPAPTAVNDSATTSEDTPVVIAVLANDSDPDGDPLTVTTATALHGSVVRNTDGTLTYTPDADYNGTDTISYNISDGQGGTASATVAVTIVPANDAPVATGSLPAQVTRDGSTVSYPTATGFADIDGDTLTYSAAGLPAGLSIEPATGLISGVVDRSASQPNGGAYSVVVTARDPSGAAATQSFTITVTNPAPVAVNDVAATHVDTPVTIAVLGNDSDPDGDPLTVTAASAARGTVTINPDGTLRYTPPTGYTGNDTVTYTISDGQGGTATATVTITMANAAPVGGPVAPQIVRDGQPVSLPVGSLFSDADGDPLSFTATGLPPGLSIDPATGAITGTIGRSASQPTGAYTTIVTASDGHGGSASTTFTWTVSNPAPVANDDSAATNEDTSVRIPVLGNDVDADGDPLTVTGATAGHGSVTINADGTITYTPDRDFNGTDTIRYTIVDGDGGTSSASVTVTVSPVNDAPTTAGLPDRITGDGLAVSKPTAPAFGDPDGDTLTYSAIGLPPGLTIDPVTGVISGTITAAANGGQNGDGVYHAIVTATDPSGAKVDAPFDWTVSQAAPNAVDDSATTMEDMPVVIPVLANDSDVDGDALTIVGATPTHGTVVISGGNLIFTPDADFNGIATITYVVSDPSGNRATATVTVTVTPVNDAPVATALPPERNQDADAVSLDVGGFFSDPDGDTLAFSATGLPAGLSIDPATGRIAGTVDRGASQVPGGVWHVTVTATDPSGAASASSFDWTIVNPAPTAVNDSATLAEDSAVTIPVLANDSDPDGDVLTVISASAGHGSVTINPDGTLNYVPAANFNGNDVIVYTIDDGNGGRATASVLVTVTPVNDAPVAVQPAPADHVTTDGATIGIAAGAYFTDPDGDALSYSASGLPAGLSIDPATGTITGTLGRSASQPNGGVYTVTVVARDPGGAETSTSFAIRVTNPGPVAVDDATRVVSGSGVTIGVLGNDSDPDGDPLTVTAATAGHGTVVINADGTLRYVPTAGYVGADTIRYSISDGEGGTASAIVSVIVDPANRPPVVGVIPPVPATGGEPVVIDVRPSVSDPDGDPVTIIDVTPTVGGVVVNPDGTFIFVPPAGYSGPTTIEVVLSDGRGGTTTTTVTVIVAPRPAADVEQLLDIGRTDPVLPPSPAPAAPVDSRPAPLILIETAESIRSLNGTAIGDHAVGDAVEAMRSLRGTSIDPDAPIAAEVARLDRLRDQRDAGDRLFDHRWGDFMVKGLTGFSTAADGKACIMVESVARDGAIYVEVRDTAAEGARAPIRSVDIRMANGGRVPDWIKVDPRGMAIIERGADMDELHLVVRVTRADGRTSSTPILIQGQTGEVELDRKVSGRAPAAPLDQTLATPNAAIQAEAMRLAANFQ